VRSVRKQKRVAFAAIGDGSTTGSLQAVLKPEQAIGYDRAGCERRFYSTDIDDFILGFLQVLLLD